MPVNSNHWQNVLVALDVRSLQIRFDAEDECAGLPVVTKLTASEGPFRVEAARRQQRKTIDKRRNAVSVVRPCVTTVGAEIEAGPGVDRNINGAVFHAAGIDVSCESVSAHANSRRERRGKKFFLHWVCIP